MRTATSAGLLISLSLALPGITDAQQLPNDADLRSAYCMPIEEGSVNLLKQVLAQLVANTERPTPEQERAIENYRQILQKQTSTLDRLRMYLMPRIPYLDPAALTAAKQRGTADFGAAQRITDDQGQAGCLIQCTTKQGENKTTVDPDACAKQCLPPSLLALRDRIASCNDPDWLPF